jgi:hypothetical protein
MFTQKIRWMSIWMMFIGFGMLTWVNTANALPMMFTDRASWKAQIADPVVTEDFEGETTGYDVLTLPYMTVGGVVIESDSASIQMLNNGLVNNSAGPHMRSWSDTGITFTFPDMIPVEAFGFDWYTQDHEHQPFEAWKLYIDNVFVTELRNGWTGFLGFIGTDTPMHSFTLKGPSGAQGGVSLDNISYHPVPEPTALFLFSIGILVMFGIKRKFAV